MSKRGNHEGSVYQRRDGRWVGVVTVNSDDGKQSRKYYYGTSRAAVADKVATAVHLLRRGVTPPNERLTVGNISIGGCRTRFDLQSKNRPITSTPRTCDSTSCRHLRRCHWRG